MLAGGAILWVVGYQLTPANFIFGRNFAALLCAILAVFMGYWFAQASGWSRRR